VGGILHLITKEDATFIIKHMIPPTLRSWCTNPPRPTPCDLHMFRLMKTFTLWFTIGKSSRVRDISKMQDWIWVPPCPFCKHILR
jgi:hypothetical protein